MIKKIMFPYSGGLPATEAIGATFYQLIAAYSAKLDEIVDYINSISGIDVNDVIAPAFTTTKSYKAGDIVEHDNLLYISIEDQNAGTWNANKWEQTTIAKRFELIRDAIQTLNGYIPLLNQAIEDITTKQQKYIETTVSLPYTAWDSLNKLTVYVADANPEDSIDIAPSVTDLDAWNDAAIRCVEVTSNHYLVFECKNTPEGTVTANIRIWRP